MMASPAESRAQAIMAELVKLEVELRRLGYWSASIPSPQALASQEPFACDCMSFPEWLQFIFIDKITEILTNAEKLPENCDISPMAEHYFSMEGIDASTLITNIRRIDQKITDE